jgi:hypothetical protein
MAALDLPPILLGQVRRDPDPRYARERGRARLVTVTVEHAPDWYGGGNRTESAEIQDVETGRRTHLSRRKLARWPVVLVDELEAWAATLPGSNG